MADEYEVEIDIMVSKIANALLADQDFMNAVMNGVRPSLLKAARQSGNSLGRFAGKNG
jgi:hypothetical protein